MSKTTLYLLQFFTTGSQVSLFILLPFIQKDFNLSLFEVGLLGSVSAISIIVFSFFAGAITERVGGRNVILISLMCNILSWILLVIAPSLIILWLVFIFSGVMSGLFGPVSNALVANNSELHNRGKIMGDFKAFGDIGKIVMTSISTFLVGLFLWRFTSLLFAIMTISLFMLYFFIQKNEKEDEPITKTKRTSIRLLLTHKKYVYSLLVSVTDAFAGASLFIFLPFLLITKGVDLKATGFFTALFFAGYLIGRLTLGRIADRLGKPQILIFAEICMSLLIFSLVYLSSYWLITLNLFLLGIFTLGTSPIIKALVAEGLEKHQFEKGYSLNASLEHTVSALGRAALGLVAAYFGIQNMFCLAGVLILLTIIPAIKLYDLS